jgi:bacterioferritin
MTVKTQKNGQARTKPRIEPQEEEPRDEAEQEEPRDEAQQEESRDEAQEGEAQTKAPGEKPRADTKEDKPRAEAHDGKRHPETRADKQTLLMGLNHDLAGEYQAVVMYTHYAAKLTGPYRKELRALFQAEIADEQGHAQFLADKIAALGGEPTTQPRPVLTADDPRAMLHHALDAEKQAIADYRQRVEQAEAFGDIGLKVDLENQLSDETRHKEEIERILAGWERK